MIVGTPKYFFPAACCFFFLLVPFTLLFADQSPEGTEDTNQFPIYSVDSVDGLPHLLKQIQGKKFYLLGDGSHGTEEFYSYRKWFTRKLVSEQGVRIVVLEAEWDSAEKVDLYVRDLLSPDLGARQMLKEAFFRWPQWVWANEELVEFVQWLKEFNRGLKVGEKVRCYGMDMQMAVAASLTRLSKEWPENSPLGRKVSRLSAWWEPYRTEPLLFNHAYVIGSETGNLLASELLGAISQPTPELRRVLEMLVAVEKYYRTTSYDNYEAWNIRSHHFAKYVIDLLETENSNRGIVVWAHNSHVGDMSGTQLYNAGVVSFGQLIREAVGRDNVFILGSGTFQGTVLASSEWGEPVEEKVVPPAQGESVELILNLGDWPNPLLFWDSDGAREAWALPLYHRGIGVTYSPDDESPDNYLVTRLSDRYDGFVFWKTTHALQEMSPP